MDGNRSEAAVERGFAPVTDEETESHGALSNGKVKLNEENGAVGSVLISNGVIAHPEGENGTSTSNGSGPSVYTSAQDLVKSGEGGAYSKPIGSTSSGSHDVRQPLMSTGSMSNDTAFHLFMASAKPTSSVLDSPFNSHPSTPYNSLRKGQKPAIGATPSEGRFRDLLTSDVASPIFPDTPPSFSISSYAGQTEPRAPPGTDACPTPASGSTNLSPLPARKEGNTTDIKKYKRDELWSAIQSDYQYLMDEEIIDQCKSTDSDFSWDDEDAKNAVSFTDFLQQYKELSDWLNQIQTFVQRQGSSLSEQYLNQSYYEEMLEKSTRRKEFIDYGRQLMRRYPSMREEITTRLQHLQSQWASLQKAVCPPDKPRDDSTILTDLKSDLDNLQRWLNRIESILRGLAMKPTWTVEILQQMLRDHQVLQSEIEAHSKIVSAVLKVCERLQAQGISSVGNTGKIDDTSAGGRDASSDSTSRRAIRAEDERNGLENIAINLEKRWHSIWLQSLEWQCRLEDEVHQRQMGNYPTLRRYSETSFDSTAGSEQLSQDVSSLGGLSEEGDSYVSGSILRQLSEELSEEGGSETADPDIIPFDPIEYQRLTAKDIECFGNAGNHVLSAEEPGESGEASLTDATVNESGAESSSSILPEEKPSSASATGRIPVASHSLSLARELADARFTSTPGVVRRGEEAVRALEEVGALSFEGSEEEGTDDAEFEEEEMERQREQARLSDLQSSSSSPSQLSHMTGLKSPTGKTIIGDEKEELVVGGSHIRRERSDNTLTICFDGTDEEFHLPPHQTSSLSPLGNKRLSAISEVSSGTGGPASAPASSTQKFSFSEYGARVTIELSPPSYHEQLDSIDTLDPEEVANLSTSRELDFSEVYGSNNASLNSGSPSAPRSETGRTYRHREPLQTSSQGSNLERFGSFEDLSHLDAIEQQVGSVGHRFREEFEMDSGSMSIPAAGSIHVQPDLASDRPALTSTTVTTSTSIEVTQTRSLAHVVSADNGYYSGADFLQSIQSQSSATSPNIDTLSSRSGSLGDSSLVSLTTGFQSASEEEESVSSAAVTAVSNVTEQSDGNKSVSSLRVALSPRLEQDKSALLEPRHVSCTEVTKDGESSEAVQPPHAAEVREILAVGKVKDVHAEVKVSETMARSLFGQFHQTQDYFMRKKEINTSICEHGRGFPLIPPNFGVMQALEKPFCCEPKVSTPEKRQHTAEYESGFVSPGAKYFKTVTANDECLVSETMIVTGAEVMKSAQACNPVPEPEPAGYDEYSTVTGSQPVREGGSRAALSFSTTSVVSIRSSVCASESGVHSDMSTADEGSITECATSAGVPIEALRQKDSAVEYVTVSLNCPSNASRSETEESSVPSFRSRETPKFTSEASVNFDSMGTAPAPVVDFASSTNVTMLSAPQPARTAKQLVLRHEPRVTTEKPEGSSSPALTFLTSSIDTSSTDPSDAESRHSRPTITYEILEQDDEFLTTRIVRPGGDTKDDETGPGGDNLSSTGGDSINGEEEASPLENATPGDSSASACLADQSSEGETTSRTDEDVDEDVGSSLRSSLIRLDTANIDTANSGTEAGGRESSVDTVREGEAVSSPQESPSRGLSPAANPAPVSPHASGSLRRKKRKRRKIPVKAHTESDSDPVGIDDEGISSRKETEDVESSTREFSEAAWDSYQDPMYSSVGVEEDEMDDTLEQFADPSLLMWEDDLPPVDSGVGITHLMGEGRRRLRQKIEPSNSDSDSDTDDLRAVVSDSTRALATSEGTLQRHHKDPYGSGIYMDPQEYAEVLACCRTNTKCLEAITIELQGRQSSISSEDIEQVHNLILSWKDTEQLAMTRGKQSTDLARVHQDMEALGRVLVDVGEDTEERKYSDVKDLESHIKALKGRFEDLANQKAALHRINDQLRAFSAQFVTVNVTGFTEAVTKATADHRRCHQSVSKRTKALQPIMLKWYARNSTFDKVTEAVVQAEGKPNGVSKKERAHLKDRVNSVKSAQTPVIPIATLPCESELTESVKDLMERVEKLPAPVQQQKSPPKNKSSATPVQELSVPTPVVPALAPVLVPEPALPVEHEMIVNDQAKEVCVPVEDVVVDPPVEDVAADPPVDVIEEMTFKDRLMTVRHVDDDIIEKSMKDPSAKALSLHPSRSVVQWRKVIRCAGWVWGLSALALLLALVLEPSCCDHQQYRGFWGIRHTYPYGLPPT